MNDDFEFIVFKLLITFEALPWSYIKNGINAINIIIIPIKHIVTFFDDFIDISMYIASSYNLYEKLSIKMVQKLKPIHGLGYNNY